MAATMDMEFGPSNPFYSPSTLPFQAPPFDRIKDSDYQPAIEAGMAQQLREIEAIANNPAPATFDNTLVAMEKSGQLYRRVMEAFDGVTGANTNPTLQQVEKVEAPKQAAHQDAIYLNDKLFQRVAAIYAQRESLHLDAESLRLAEVYYQRFVHAGAKLSDAELAVMLRNRETTALLTWEPYLHNPKLRHRLHRIASKALFLRGEHDGLISAAYMEGYAKLLPNARTLTLPDCAHVPQLEQPEAFVAACVAFLDEEG